MDKAALNSDIALAVLARAADLGSLDDAGFRALARSTLLAVGPQRGLGAVAEHVVASWISLWAATSQPKNSAADIPAADLIAAQAGIELTEADYIKAGFKPPKNVKPSPTAEIAKPSATDATIARALAKAEGRLVDLPTDPAARAIIAADGKARNEPME